MSMASPTLAGAPQWQREVWRRQQDEMVAVPSYLDVDKAEADSFLAYVARLRSASPTASSTATATTTAAATTTASTSSAPSSPQSSPSTKKKQEKQKKEKRRGSGIGATTAGGGEKAANKRWKRRKQSLGEVEVSEEAPAATTSPKREGIAETVIADRVQIQVRALARYNLLARATTPVVEREA